MRLTEINVGERSVAAADPPFAVLTFVDFQVLDLPESFNEIHHVNY